jgi:hypothetical protein
MKNFLTINNKIKKIIIILGIFLSIINLKAGGSFSKNSSINKEKKTHFEGLITLDTQTWPRLVGLQKPSQSTFLEPTTLLPLNNKKELTPDSLLLPIKAWTPEIESELQDLFFHTNQLEGKIIPQYFDLETLIYLMKKKTLSFTLGERTFTLTIPQQPESEISFKKTLDDQLKKALTGYLSYITAEKETLIEKGILENESSENADFSYHPLTKKYRLLLETFLEEIKKNE